MVVGPAELLVLLLCSFHAAHGAGPNQQLPFQEEVFIAKGTHQLGTDDQWFAADKEGPAREVELPAFVADAYEVTNDRFADFVSQTGYESEAHKFGWSFVHMLAVSPEVNATIDQAVAGLQWWLPVPNATWEQPEGADRDLRGRGNHPVLQMSRTDAEAFCSWARPGGRLLTEAEWEAAARAGKRNRLYPWGNKLQPRGQHRANIWQGTFPEENTAEDGFVWAAPVDAFGPQNGWGLHGVAGNAWEWTSTEWCDPEWLPPDCRGRPRPADEGDVEFVKKGGSFLCHKSWCYRWRTGARSKTTSNSGAQNIGIRCGRDATAAEEARLGAVVAVLGEGGRVLQARDVAAGGHGRRLSPEQIAQRFGNDQGERSEL